MIDIKDCGKSLMIMFGKNVEKLEYDKDGILIHNIDCHKSAVTIDTERYLNSQNLNKDKIHHGLPAAYPKRKSKTISPLPNLDMNNIASVINKNYLVALSYNQRELILLNGETLEKVSSIFIHGKGKKLKVAKDERTIIVGCNDGRLLIVTLTVCLTDHIKEHLIHLPSRNDSSNHKNILTEDIKRANFYHVTTADGKVASKSIGKMINLAQSIKKRHCAPTV